MAITVRSHQRVVAYKVDGRAALELRQQGKSLSQIKAALGTDASIPTISRAIERAKAAE
jgi:hypothetical protein